jgi:Tol biopolymer transport system component
VDGKGASIGSEHWSPDGRQIVFEWHPAGKAEIHVAAAGGGPPRTLLADGYDNTVPVWSRDGGWVYFNSTRTGRPEIWKIAATGGSPVQITHLGAVAAAESPDGGMLFFLDSASGSDSRTLWRVPLGNGLPAGQPERVLEGLKRADWSNWALAKNGICYIRRVGEDVDIEYLDFGTGRTRRIYDLQRPPAFGGGLTLSPDGQWVLFTQVDRDGSSIFVQ